MNKAIETHKHVEVFAPFDVVTGTKYSYSDKVGTGTANSATGIDCAGWRKAFIIQSSGVKAASDTCILTGYVGAASTVTTFSTDTALIVGLSLAPSAAGTGTSVQKAEIDLTAMAGRYLYLKQVAVGASSGVLPTHTYVILMDPIVAPGGDTVVDQL